MTRVVRFSNNAVSKLDGAITAASTTLLLQAGDGSKFPSLTGAQFFMATLVKSDGTTEVVKVTARTGDTLTVVRAAEAVSGVQTAYAFSAGDRIEHRLTAKAIGDELDRLDQAALISALNKTANYTVTQADVTSLVRMNTASGNLTVTLPDISTLTDDFDVIVAKVSADNNVVTIARSGTDTINGTNTYSLTNQWQGAWLTADRSTGTWTVIASGSGVKANVDSFTGTGTPGPFTLSGDPGIKENTAVYVGGVYQQKSTYTLVGTSLTMGGNVAVGVSVEVVWATPLSVGITSANQTTASDGASGSLWTTVQGALDWMRAKFTALSSSTGSTLVGFIQAGIGAVLRTAQDKMRERVSVADFGIVPDGTTNWESVGGSAWSSMLQASLTKVVVWPPGYYATGINLDSSYSGARFHFEEGAVLGGVFHLISDSAPTTAPISSISRASGVVTVVTSSAHGYSTGQRCAIFNVYVTGAGSTDFNTDDVTITVVNSTTFTYAQSGNNESGVVSYGAGVSQRPIKNVVITGRLTTTDRFGTINCNDCYVERVWVKSDPTQHSAYPGTTCRGAHLYVGTKNLTIDELIIDDASGANTDAALAIDGNAWNPSNLKVGYCWIKDSDYHGAYITGGGHRFGELRIDGFARGVYTGTLQDSDGATQSQQVKGLWTNRVWDMEIGVLRTSQNPAGSRGYELNQAVIDETGSVYFGKLNQGLHIGSWFANNVRRYGIGFGDRVADSVRCNVTIGLMEVRLDPAGLSAGEFAMRAVGATSGSRVSIDTLRLIDLGANAGLWTETTADVSIRRFELINHADRALQARGRVNIVDLHGVWSGGSSANPVLHWANPAVAGSRIENLHLESAGAVTVRAVQADSGCGGWDIQKITTSGLRHNSGTIYLDSITSWGIHTVRMVGPDSTGIAIRFNGSSTDGFMGPGRVEGFDTGIDRNAATLSRITAVGLNMNGNTTPTNVPAGQIQMVGCNGVTL